MPTVAVGDGAIFFVVDDVRTHSLLSLLGSIFWFSQHALMKEEISCRPFDRREVAVM